MSENDDEAGALGLAVLAGLAGVAGWGLKKFFSTPSKIAEKAREKGNNSKEGLEQKKNEIVKMLEDFGAFKVEVFNNRIRPFYTRTGMNVPKEVSDIYYILTSANNNQGAVAEYKSNKSYLNLGTMAGAAVALYALSKLAPKEMSFTEKISDFFTGESEKQRADAMDKLKVGAVGLLGAVVLTRSQKVTEATEYSESINKSIADNWHEISELETLRKSVDYLTVQIRDFSEKLAYYLNKCSNEELCRSSEVVGCAMMLCKFYTTKIIGDNNKIISVEEIKQHQND